MTCVQLILSKYYRCVLKFNVGMCRVWAIARSFGFVAVNDSARKQQVLLTRLFFIIILKF